ncbi:nucleolar protein 9, partial [Trichonephila clavata]
MEDQKLFYEDRKGNFHSGKRKSDNPDQTASNTPFKQHKTFNRGAPQSHPSENYRNRKYSDKSNTFQNRRYPDKESYSSQNFHNNSFEPSNRNKNRGAPQSHLSENYRNRKYNDNKSNTSGNRRYPDEESYSSQNNALEPNNNRNRNTHEDEEKDQKLIDLISYYKKTLKTMKEGLSNEETEIFASNVLTESEGYEVRLSCNPIISHCIEYLLSISKDPTVSRKFMAAFGLEKEEVCTNASASHITELLLNIALQNIQNWQLVLKLEETDPERENVSYFMSWISDFGEFIIENFHLCLQNQFTCHVVCSEIRALGGDMSSATDFMSKKSVNHKKHFRHEFGEESSKAEFFVPVILRDVPELFTKLLKKIAKTFLKMEETELIDCVTGGSSAIVVETLLCILKKRLPKKCKKFISGLATKIFSEKNDDNIPKAFLHKNCSFMVEKMFASANEGLQLSLWNDYIANSLEYLVTHVVGNYVIQRLFDVVESKEQ